MRNSKQKLFEVLDIEDDVVEMQYGGGLSDAYSTLSDRRQNMYGMGESPSQMSSAFQDPMEASAFSPVNMEHGGDIVVPKERMINDQPHELSYINPQEAGLLKALGGSGRRVDGIPAYYDTDDEGFYGDDSSSNNSNDFGDDQGSYQDQYEQAMSRQSPSLASLVDQGIIGEDEAYISDQFGPSIALAAAQARAQDIKDSKQDMGDSIRYLGRPNRSEIRNIQDDDVAKLQDLIDADQLVGAGIPVANMLEKDYGLRTFSKGLRSGLEQYSQGRATNRDDPNLGGFVDDPEVVKDFLMELERAKPGETMFQLAERYSKETGREAPLGRIGFDPSSSRDMSKNAADVNSAIQENNLKGAIQGFGLFGGMFTGAGGLGNFTQGYTGEFKGTTPQSQTAFGAATSGLSKGLGLDTLVDKFGNIISTGKEAIFGPEESEFKQREAVAREQLGREPTLEEVNNVNLSSSSISPSDVLGFVDNPFSALVALGSGKPTTAADIARAREEAEKDKNVELTNTIDRSPKISIRPAVTPEEIKESRFFNMTKNIKDYNAAKKDAESLVNKYNAYLKTDDNSDEETKAYDAYVDAVNKSNENAVEFLSSDELTFDGVELDDLLFDKGDYLGGESEDLSIRSGAMDVDRVPEGELSRENLIDLRFDDPEQNPEQNIFERGIGAVVDLFGGPEAAFRNNIDTSFDSGNDQPKRRVAPPPKIPEVLSAAIEQAEPIPVEDSGLSARELSLGPQVNTLILQGVDPSTAVRQVGIDQGDFTVAQILKLLGVS